MSKFSIEGNEYKLLRTLPKSNLPQDTAGSDVATNETRLQAGTAESLEGSVTKHSEHDIMTPTDAQVANARDTNELFKPVVKPESKDHSVDCTENSAKDDDADSSFAVSTSTKGVL